MLIHIADTFSGIYLITEINIYNGSLGFGIMQELVEYFENRSDLWQNERVKHLLIQYTVHLYNLAENS